MPPLNAKQCAVLTALHEAAAKRDAAEAEWRAAVKVVDNVLNKAEAVGMPQATAARAANVSRQYLHKRAAAKKAAASEPVIDDAGIARAMAPS